MPTQQLEERRASARPDPENPLAEGLERSPLNPTVLVLFGATGDLARRSLLPALYNLAHDGLLPQLFALVGLSRDDLSDDGFREMAARCVRRFSRRPPDPEVLERLLGDARHITGAVDRGVVYESLRGQLAGLEERADVALDRCFYLATPPRLYAPIVARLAERGLGRVARAEVRIAIEKPFGTSLEDAQRLNGELASVFEESQVFRIDHLLGKETIQNILALRFANQVFEPVWNRKHVEHVQVTAAESSGIGTRAEHYDSTGALRDMVQNDMLQLLCQVAIEPPIDFGSESVRSEKVKVLRAIEPPAPVEIDRVAVRGQYAAGTSGGREVSGYLEEQGIPEGSTTETFAALRLEVANWRWAGVPFYVRTGKRLARELTEVAVTLKPVPHLGFEQAGSVGARPNQLVLSIDPEEGVSLLVVAKIPGTRMRVRPVKMEFLYGLAFPIQPPDPYERLVLDMMRGDQTLFTGDAEVEAGWRICDPVLEAWEAARDPPPRYPAGSQGPAEADRLLLPGHSWRRI
jgi:glucose-6-phosphate 1-dehydrogenase